MGLGEEGGEAAPIAAPRNLGRTTHPEGAAANEGVEEDACREEGVSWSGGGGVGLVEEEGLLSRSRNTWEPERLHVPSHGVAGKQEVAAVERVEAGEEEEEEGGIVHPRKTAARAHPTTASANHSSLQRVIVCLARAFRFWGKKRVILGERFRHVRHSWSFLRERVRM